MKKSNTKDMNELLWTPKFFTKKGLVKENILEGKKVLDVGCGLRKLPGSVGIDIIKAKEVDYAHNLNSIPWPFGSDQFDIVFINSTLEHVQNPLEVLGEMHRVLKKGGRLVIKVPYFRSLDAFADPTHYHFFTSQSLDFFIDGTEFSRYDYAPFRFKKMGFWYGWPHKSDNFLKQIFKDFIHKYPIFYDKYLSFLFPAECLFWELEVKK